MVNQQYLNLLKQGAEVWNTWRSNNPTVRPDLSKAKLSGVDLCDTDLTLAQLGSADLRGAKLSGADLTFANLRGAKLNSAELDFASLGSTDFNWANLSKANIRGANLYLARLNNADLSEVDLRQADLTHAHLEGANLNGTNLSEANLFHANLYGVNLRGADLRGANFNYADLDEVDFSYTHMRWTVLGDFDLRLVKGLETVIHEGPSSLSLNTLYLSHGDIPEAFVRGTGAPDSFIEYMHSLVTRPLEYYSCFISHAKPDQVFAERLYTDLQHHGVRCWFAPHDLRPGTPILRGIEEAIGYQDRVLLILSKQAVSSVWIEREVDAALHQEIKRGQDVLFPIRLDNTVLESNAGWAIRLQHRHIGDFTDWQKVNRSPTQ